MSLKTLLTDYKGDDNPLHKIISNFHLIDGVFNQQTFLSGTIQHRVVTKLNSARELIKELEKLVSKDVKQTSSLDSLDLTKATNAFNSLVNYNPEEEILLQALVDFVSGEILSRTQKKSNIDNDIVAGEFINDFLALEEEYKSSHSSFASMDTHSDNSSDEEEVSSNSSPIMSDEDRKLLVEYTIQDDIEGFMAAYKLQHQGRTYDVNSKNQYNLTALQIAATNGSTKFVKFLLEHGALIDGYDIFKTTPLQLAILYNHLEVAELLLQQGANPNMGDVAGLTPMHIAAEKGRIQSLEMLAKYNGNFHVVTNQGSTIIHSAALGIKNDGNTRCWKVLEWLFNNNLDKDFIIQHSSSVSDILENSDISYFDEYQALVENLGEH